MKKSSTTGQLSSSEDGAAPPPGISSGRREWSIRFDLGLAVALFVVIAGTVCLWWLGGEVIEGTHPLDLHWIQAFRNPANPADAIGPAALEEAARDITGLGGYAVLSGLTIAVATFLMLSGKHHASLLLLGATTGGLLAMRLIKFLVNRPRPDLVPHLSHVNSPSFPSGHAMLSAVVYLTLGAMLALLVEKRRIKLFLVSVALLLTLLIGISRVYLGVHYPTDVIGGWIAGTVWATLCWLLTRFLQRRGAIEPSESTEN